MLVAAAQPPAPRGGEEHKDESALRHGSVKYPDSSRYEGELLHGKRHGKGVFRLANGDSYMGNFRLGLRSGFGVFVHVGKESDGMRYEGHWHAGKRSGRGLQVFGNGDSYDGDFFEDQIEGTGLYVYHNGDRYSGALKRGRWHGLGRLEKASGNVYEGSFRNGKPHGYGVHKYVDDGGSYAGDHVAGVPHGKGLRIFSSGTRCDGSFVRGRMCGEGVLSTFNGDVYVGALKDDVYHGFGVITYAHGDRYEGQWLKGAFYGQGKYTYADGGFYDGEFLAVHDHYNHGIKMPCPNNKRHGRGVRLWSSGNRYDGHWVDGKMQGFGTMHYADGSVYEGAWEADQPHGRGTRVYGNDEGRPYEAPLALFTGHGKILNPAHFGRCKYVGEWRRGIWHGDAVYTCGDGTAYKGTFVNGKRHGFGEQTLIPTLLLQKNALLYRAEKYTGTWNEGLLDGRGTLSYEKGARTIVADFSNSTLVKVVSKAMQHRPNPSTKEESMPRQSQV